MLVALLGVGARREVPLLLLSYACEAEEEDGLHRYELMVASGTARVRTSIGLAMMETHKTLTPAELAGLKRAVAPLPFATAADVCPTRGGEFASLQIVDGPHAWNVSHAPLDPRWQAFDPVLQWIRTIFESRELRKVGAKVCGTQ